jgi:hypothetical protein
MSRILELPDVVYAKLERAAAAAGLTPADWVDANTPEDHASESKDADAPQPTLAERFAGRVGVIDTGGRARAAENIGERFAEHLAAKRREGRL